jgi:hypothetical protein
MVAHSRPIPQSSPLGIRIVIHLDIMPTHFVALATHWVQRLLPAVLRPAGGCSVCS